MTYIGGDPAGIRQFASAVASRRNQIEATTHRLSRLVDSVPWAGADRERFVGEWRSVHEPNISRLLTDMIGLSQDANNAASRQEQASRG